MSQRDRRNDGTDDSAKDQEPIAASGDAGESRPSPTDGAATNGSADESSDSDSSDVGAFDFQALAQGRREVLVRLAGQTYRLRWTRNDKLILTK